MRIRAWRVDGFGVFRDYEERRLSPGLNVFCGPNEAGKTTLLAFLRAMFFGFPPGERAKSYYPPLRGRRHGGALEVEVGTGEIITIERHPRRRQPVKLTFDGGRRGNESDLRRLLGGIDERLFRSVFAFSLTELQAFESLSSEAVEEHLYSATLAGESRAARRVIAFLDELAERRLPSGGDSRIAELARELESVDERLERETTALERYLVLVAEEDELGRRTAALDHEAAAERQEIARLGELVALSPLWTEVAEIRERLAQLANVTIVPRDAATRHAAAREKLRAGDAERAALEEEIERREDECREVASQLDEDAFQVSERVTKHADELALHRQTLERLAAARDELERRERAAAAALARVPGGSATVAAFESDAKLAEDLETLAGELELALDAQAGARRAFAEQAATVRRLTLVRDELRTHLSVVEPPFLAEIDRRDAAARALRSSLAELRGEEEAERTAEDQERSLLHDVEELESQRIEAPSKLASTVAFFVGLGSIALAIRELDLDRTQGLVFFGLIAIGSIVASALLGSRRRRIEREAARIQAAVKRRRSEVEEVRARLEANRARIRDLHASVDTSSRALGVPGAISYQAIEERVAELVRLRADRIAWDERVVRLEESTRHLAEAREREDAAAAEVSRAQETVHALQDLWRERVASAGLESTLEPTAFAAWLDAIETARESQALRDRARQEVEELVLLASRWEEPVRELLRDAGDDFGATVAGEALASRFVALRQRTEADAELRARLARLEEKVAERRERLAAAREEVESAAAELAGLYAEVGAHDEASFFERITAHETRARLEERLTEKEAELAARLEACASVEEVVQALRERKPESLREEIHARESRLAEIRRARDEAIRHRGETERARRDLEALSRVAALELEREALVTELREAIEEWRATTLAAALLEETLADYERHRQPRVLAEASKIFARVTAGRYVELRQAHDGDDILAVERNRRTKATRELSRGTAEQLYLSLRLALVRELASRGLSLPIVMDDVFVNFDPERARNTALAIAELAGDQQILIFSCQPHTARMLEEVAPGTAVLELGGGPIAEETELPRSRIPPDRIRNLGGAHASEAPLP